LTSSASRNGESGELTRNTFVHVAVLSKLLADALPQVGLGSDELVNELRNLGNRAEEELRIACRRDELPESYVRPAAAQSSAM
jgi:hypothetical protein